MSRYLRLAVTGHRLNQLPEAKRPALKRQIAAALKTLEEAAQAASLPTPMLASALAEGADRYAAHAALARGWRIEAPLPFLIPRYEQDFESPASIQEFQTLLQRARRVFPIDGEALIAAGQGGAAPYAAVGAALLEGAHAVLAVWNGAPKKGPGGTAEVVENALGLGAAVIWLKPEAEAARLLAPLRPARRGALRRRLAEALAERLQLAAFPVEAIAAA